MLTIKNLHAGYNELTILHGVELTVKQGEIVALIGPNGAGKSTVLKAIFNLCSVTSASISFENKSIRNCKTHELLRRGISLVTQGKINFSDLTVKENLLIGATYIEDEKEVTQRLTNVYKRFPVLQEKQDNPAFSLSGGQQQMLAIGRALMQGPKLLLMDEPTLGLSPLLQKQLFQILLDLRSEGISILVVEQNAKKAIETADKTYLLENGQIVLEGGKEILDNPKIQNVYLGGA